MIINIAPGDDVADTRGDPIRTLASKVVAIKFTTWEGGEWNTIYVHSLEMPDGAQWDVLNGWRNAPRS